MVSNTCNVERLLILSVRHDLARRVASPFLSVAYGRTPRLAKEGVAEGRCSTCSTCSTRFTTCELCDHFVAGRGRKGGERRESGERKAESGRRIVNELTGAECSTGNLPERVAQFQGNTRLVASYAAWIVNRPRLVSGHNDDLPHAEGVHLQSPGSRSAPRVRNAASSRTPRGATTPVASLGVLG
jgi:hypothetical protein